MNNREKFIKSLETGMFKNGLKNGEITDSERMAAIDDYSKNRERKDFESYKFFMNTSAYDEIKEVQVASYRGDEEI